MSGKGPFIRESSGLVKQVSFLDAVMINFGNMSAGVALYTGVTPLVRPGSDLVLASIIAFLASLPQVYIYTYFMRKVPRTGGDYIWLSRFLNGHLGVVFALMLMVESTAYFALTAFFASTAINNVLVELGVLYNNQGLLSLGGQVDPFTSPWTAFAIGATIFTLLIAVNIARARWGFKLVTIFGALSAIGTVTAFAVLLVNLGSFNQNLPTIENVMNATVTDQPFSMSWADTLFMIPFLALFTYPWMQAGPAIAAEIRGEKALKYNVLIALFITFVLVTAGYAVVYALGGYSVVTQLYMNTGFGNPPYFIPFTFWTLAILMAHNLVIGLVIGIGLISWELFILSYGVIIFSRYTFALAFDRALPDKLAEVNPKTNSPVYTHLLDLVLTLALLAFITFIGANNALSLYGMTFLAALYFAAVAIAGLLYSIRKERNPLLTVASLLMAIYFAYLTYVSATNPDFGFMLPDGSPNPLTVEFVTASFLFIVAVYVIMYFYRKSQGIDINAVYKYIPPE